MNIATTVRTTRSGLHLYYCHSERAPSPTNTKVVSEKDLLPTYPVPVYALDELNYFDYVQQRAVRR